MLDYTTVEARGPLRDRQDRGRPRGELRGGLLAAEHHPAPGRSGRRAHSVGRARRRAGGGLDDDHGFLGRGRGGVLLAHAGRHDTTRRRDGEPRERPLGGRHLSRGHRRGDERRHPQQDRRRPGDRGQPLREGRVEERERDLGRDRTRSRSPSRGRSRRRSPTWVRSSFRDGATYDVVFQDGTVVELEPTERARRGPRTSCSRPSGRSTPTFGTTWSSRASRATCGSTGGARPCRSRFRRGSPPLPAVRGGVARPVEVRALRVGRRDGAGGSRGGTVKPERERLGIGRLATRAVRRVLLGAFDGAEPRALRRPRRAEPVLAERRRALR